MQMSVVKGRGYVLGSNKFSVVKTVCGTCRAHSPYAFRYNDSAFQHRLGLSEFF